MFNMSALPVNKYKQINEYTENKVHSIKSIFVRQNFELLIQREIFIEQPIPLLLLSPVVRSWMLSWPKCFQGRKWQSKNEANSLKGEYAAASTNSKKGVILCKSEKDQIPGKEKTLLVQWEHEKIYSEWVFLQIKQ